MTRRRPLARGFLEHLRSLGVLGEPGPWIVALSGGCDSVVLLHLLRRHAGDLGLPLTAVHLDHAMRPESGEDAAWVADLCASWGVPLVTRRLESPPSSEDAARRARHAFLREVARARAARWIATAHHADDQAETVLFRALRGTGLEGLSGMAAATRDGIVRPLLPFWRGEIEAYAREQALEWRTDATNLSLEPARNRIRHELIPLAERTFAPAARRNLVRLAALAREAEVALRDSVRRAEEEAVTREDGAFLLARSRLRVYDSGIGARLLRQLLRRLGVVLDRAGTRATLQFIRNAPSGREMYLPSGVRVRIEFDVARIERDLSREPDSRLAIGEAEEAGEGEIRLQGRRYLARWRVGEPEAEGGRGGWAVALSRDDLRFPLLLRGWEPGDRMRTSGGSKTLKKLFLEHRVPRTVRARLPVLVDGSGRVLWVGGIPRPPATPPVAGRDALILSVLDA